MAYKPKPGEIASLELAALRLQSGWIQLGATKDLKKRTVPDFPKEIEVCNRVYTLEDVRKDAAPPLEWGIYV